MSTSIDTQIGLPSGRSISKWIKDAQEVEVRLTNSDSLTGKLRWQDQDCLGMLGTGDQEILIWKHAIAYIRPQR
jgi:host factor-I protein